MTLSRIRVPLGFAVGALILYLSTPALKLIVAGIPLALFGLVWRATAAGVIRKDRNLATGGPYRFTRNPLYFGSFLLALGVSVMSGSLVCALLILVPFGLVYPGVMRREESHLSRLFGEEYERFRRSVPVFFPRGIGSEMLESFSFERYRTNGEYNAGIGLLATVILLVLKALA